MEILHMLVDLIGKTIWPITTLTIILIFRKQINKKFLHITEITSSVFNVKMKADIEALVEEKIEEKKEEDKLVISAILKENPLDINQYNKTDLISSEKEDTTLLAFACGKTLKQNLEYKIYFDPATRRHITKFKYIGLYSNKAIVAVGELKKVVSCNYKDGELIGTHDYNLSNLTTDEANRIKGIIKSFPNDWNLSSGLKFYLVDEFYDTKYIKESSSPLRGKQYIWLDEISGFKENFSAEELSKFLKSKKW